MIFDYWKHHMECPVESIEWAKYCETDWHTEQPPYNLRDAEGLFWYDGHNATFWYMLNLEWYRMNDKLYANTFNKEPFDPYLRDFDEEYLRENNYL